MRVTHGHGDGGMPKDALKAEDVPSPHDVVTGKGVTQDVGQLTRGAKPTTFVRATECRPAGHEEVARSRHADSKGGLFDFLRNGNGSRLTIFGAVEMRFTAKYRGARQAFSLIPAGTRSQADQRNRTSTATHALLTRLSS